MELQLDFQKMCQIIDTRKLVLLMSIVASLVIVVQFLSIPYGSVLLSVFPSVNVTLVGKFDHSAGDSYMKSQVIGGVSPSSDSMASYSSESSVAVRNTSDSDLGDEGKGNDGSPDNNFELGDRFGNLEDSHNGSRELENGSQQGKNSLENVEKEGSALTLEGGQNEDSSLVPLAPALQPVSSPANLTSPRRTDVNSSTSVISGSSNVSSVGEQSESMLPKDKKPEMVGTGQANVQNKGSVLTLERGQSEGSSFAPPAPTLQPVASPANLSSPRKINVNSSTSVISGNSNVSSVGEQPANTISKDKKPEIVGTGQATSHNNSTTTGNSIQKGSLELPATPVISISEMNLLLLKSHASSRSMIPRWPSIRDQDILSAKSQIENPPILKNNQDLYAPIFHNVSMFKRSYELMERTLKVYVYKEGARPIFHQPETKGIYASEGWFMKLMEGNKQFSVNDPKKAHLFYLPFSTRRLEQFLYVPNSHSHKNLVEHLKTYLDLITSKYPFWNRTGGADHFVVACHDWAPAETTQYMSSCIRAMCNADVNVGFELGKDASLPETNIRVAKDPLRDLGGKPPSKREILAFFAGSMHGYLRPILLQLWENKDPDMQIYGHMGRSGKHKTIYAQHMKNSKYCICAKGFEVNSPRVIEAIFYECVPVIISDNFVPPFLEVLNWETFAVFVPEKEIPNLKNILLSIPEEKYLRLQMRVKMVQQHFLWHPKPVKYDIFHMILHSVWYNRVFQINLG